MDRTLIPVDEAHGRIAKVNWRDPGTESVSLAAACGRILAEPIQSDRDSPPFDRAMMDGYAIKAATMNTRMPLAPRTIFPGEEPGTLDSGHAVRIMTGAALPDGADAVVRLEDTAIESNHLLVQKAEVATGLNVSPRGEESRADSTLLPVGSLLRADAISTAASCGYAKLRVRKLPEVGLVSTGSEIVDVEKTPTPYQIRNSNRWLLHALLASRGIVLNACHARDDRDELASAISSLLSHRNALIITGGVSRGDRDYVAEVLSELGVKILFHGVAMRPGKPLLCGIGPEDTPVFALPGPPFSAMVTYHVFVRPLLDRMAGRLAAAPHPAKLLDTKTKSHSFTEFFRVKSTGDGLRVVSHRGSSDMAATLFSDGIALQPPDAMQLAPDSQVAFLSWDA